MKRDEVIEKHATLFFDGGDRGGKIGAAGAVLTVAGDDPTASKTYNLSEVFQADFTSNSCEYVGLLLGLRKAVALEVTHIQIWGDSRLVVNQVNRTWRCNFPHLQVLRDEAIALLKRFEYKEIKWVSREKNIDADAVCNQAMNRALKASKTKTLAPTRS